MLEVELGNYAAMNAEDPGVKRFGRTMADDHTQANQELELLAQRQGIRIQSGMTPEHREEATRLMALHGAEFDEAYVDAMVDGHENAVAAFSAQAKQDRSDVDRWAAATLPRLRQHLEHARELKQSESERVSSR
jgi:putative membrane protein